MNWYRYGQEEMDALARVDKRMGEAIACIGLLKREVTDDPFDTLISSVIAQQISSKASESIYARLQALTGGITAAAIARASAEQIQSCGMSMRKAGYIKGISESAVNGAVDFDALRQMDDEQVVKTLSALRGVGVWTAEMLLLFCLQRPDIVSWGDFGIRKGMMKLYGLSELDKNTFAELRERYRPFGSVASLYLWEIAARPSLL